MCSHVELPEYACLLLPLHTHTHICHTQSEQMFNLWNWNSVSPDRYGWYFTDLVLIHHSVTPHAALFGECSLLVLVCVCLFYWIEVIILVCMSLALSCVCWVEADGPHVPDSDVLCHSSLTRWHLPHHRRLCAPLITVTADLQIAKNPRAVSICSASSRWMGDKTHSRRTHTHACADFQSNAAECRGRSENTHTHT